MSWFKAKHAPRVGAAALLVEDFRQLASEPLVLSGAFPAAFSSPHSVMHIVRALADQAGHTMCRPLEGCHAPELRLGDVFQHISDLAGGATYENLDALDSCSFAQLAFAGLPYAGAHDGMGCGRARAALLVATRGGATTIRRLPGLAAWLLLADGHATAYLRGPGGAGTESWQASVGPTETLMVPDGWAFQVSFSAGKALAVLSPYVPAHRLPPDAPGPPSPRPLPAELSYRGALAPIHLQERHAFLEAYRSAASSRVDVSTAVVRVVSLRSPGNSARRQKIADELLGPLLDILGVDARFFDAVNGRTLGLSAEAMGSGARQRCMFHRMPGGRDLWADVDPSMWVGLADEPLRQAHIQKHSSMFRAELDRAAFHHGLYHPATPALGMVGNHLSHAALWHEFEAMGVEWGLIVEDDAVPDPHLGTNWPEIVRALVAELARLEARGEQWDVFFVGRTLSGTPERRSVTPLTVEVGWTLRTHCYAVSRRGVQRLIAYGLASNVFHCAMDEVLAAMAAGDHWHEPFAARLRELGCLGSPFRILGLRFEGVVYQLMDVEDSDASISQCVGEGADRI